MMTEKEVTSVLAIDAGRSVGAAVIDFPWGSSPNLRHVHQFRHDDDVTLYKAVVDLLYKYHYVDVLVVEQFDLRPGNKFVADLTPVKLNAVIEFENAHHPKRSPIPMVWQTPAQAKGLVSNEALKNLGMWPTGKTVDQPDADDARDAIRHAIRYGVNVLKHMPTISEGWPQEQEQTTEQQGEENAA